MDGEGRVAVVGVGRMGAAMVATLRRAGVEVVVCNRTRSKAEAAAEATGAAVAATPREAAAAARVVLSSLADDAAVGAAYAGRDGVVAGLQPGATPRSWTGSARCSTPWPSGSSTSASSARGR
jgi:3-hydroxyisobutyrate dehydrogenase-like beta-hydroxyacid dehydrogenase